MASGCCWLKVYFLRPTQVMQTGAPVKQVNDKVLKVLHLVTKLVKHAYFHQT